MKAESASPFVTKEPDVMHRLDTHYQDAAMTMAAN
jgi:hypothetical protein